jgi:hypothetical protein
MGWEFMIPRLSCYTDSLHESSDQFAMCRYNKASIILLVNIPKYLITIIHCHYKIGQQGIETSQPIFEQMHAQAKNLLGLVFSTKSFLRKCLGSSSMSCEWLQQQSPMLIQLLLTQYILAFSGSSSLCLVASPCGKWY